MRLPLGCIHAFLNGGFDPASGEERKVEESRSCGTIIGLNNVECCYI